jgi:hypothetical protein
MSNIYSRIYSNLCSKGKLLKEHYVKGSNLHRHHIIPRHTGGLDEDDNYTYLTVREHIIAHFLLWKIHKNVNDLRSMYMLGANLTYEQRRIVGLWCKENKIGWFCPEVQKIARKNAMKKQKEMNSKQTFYYWSTPDGRKERASLGGKASILSGNNHEWAYWASEEGRLERASLGGKSHKGKRCMYKPGDNSFKRVKPEDIDTYLKNGYIFGSPIKSKNQYTKVSS